MKIVVFAGFYLPYIGGYIKNIHELSRRLVKDGHEVYVITCDTENLKDDYIDGVVIIRLPSWNLLNGTFPVPKLSKTLINCLFNKKAVGGVVITQTRFFITSLLGLIYSKNHRLPLIHVERGTCHSVVPNRLVSVLAQVYDHTIGSLIVRSAKVNIGVSQSACDFIKHLGGKNTQVVHNGIETYLLKNNSSYDICYVGRLIYAKGVQDLIEAFNKCSIQNNNLRLLIVGDGNYKQELERQANESKFRENILFYGTKDHKEVIDILSKSDIFVNPSYSEGLPTSVMEAASVGLSIIATDVGGTNEIIEHNKSGILYKPHDVDQLAKEIMGLIKDATKSRKLGFKALCDMKDYFSWDDITNQYQKILKEIIVAK